MHPFLRQRKDLKRIVKTLTQLSNKSKIIKINYNRLSSKVSSITYKMKQSSNSQRNLRTRTLIQLGGLLSLSGLPSLLNIQEGDDLQADISTRDKAAILLGMLSEMMETVDVDSDHHCWLEKGRRLLKQKM